MSARKLGMVAYRVLWLVFFGLIAADLCFGLSAVPWWGNFAPAVLAYAVIILVNRWGGAPDRPSAAREPVEVAPPVTGRWSALNSPADRTPSHGVHSYGQTFAIDILAEPEPGARPGFGWLWPLARRPQAFPAYGAPLLAVADATVVRAEDRQRDHLTRTSLPGLLYLMLPEGMVREVAGVSRILGNHLVLDLGDGIHAAYAHLRRGSLTVREGDRVRAGQVLARCGNSGNSSEPHLHFQLMDGPDPDAARGIPFTWRGIGVPRNGETFEVPPLSQPAPRLTPMPPAKKRTRSYDHAKIRTAVLAQFGNVRAAVAGLTPEQLARPTRLGDWTVRDLVAHIGMSLGAVSRLLALPEPPKQDGTLLDWPCAIAADAPDIAAHARELAERHPDPAAHLAAVEERFTADLAAHPGTRLLPTSAGALPLADYLVTRTVELVVHTDDLNAAVPGLDIPRDRQALAACTRLLADALAAKAPGGSTEVRVPPYAVVQCVAGPRHTRGTPPNVVETDPLTWIRLATGRLAWAEALHDAKVSASGERADLSAHLPLMA